MADNRNLEGLLHEGNNKLTANMLSEVVKENSDKSVIMSAFSVMTPLAQLAFAAVGPSHDELLDAIGLPDDNVTKAVFSLVNTKLKSIEGVELKTANKVYIPFHFELNPKYAAVSRDIFDSEVGVVDFIKNEEAAKEINAWVEEHTNNRIQNLVDPADLGPNSRAVLVNALYFKGSWAATFNKALTKENNFHVSKEKVVRVPMMYRNGNYLYWKSNILQSTLLEIPYVGKKSSMLIVLPDEIDGIKPLVEKLKDLSVLEREVKSAAEIEVEVTIPKFKIETTTDLKKILQKMKIKKVFNAGEARLDNLLTGQVDLYVSSATQKAFIEVNEEGAEATAANQFGVSYATSFTPRIRYRFVADHPFLFFLKENDNILFSGVYYG